MLPVIDIAALDGGDAAAEAAVAGAIGRACREIGFFYVTGHGVPAPLVAETFAASRRFFALPAAAKEEASIRRSPHNRGYVALGDERLQADQPADRKECFNIGLELAADDPEVRAGRPFRGINLWPALPGWRDTMLAYYDACWTLSRRLNRAFAIDLGLAPDFFAPTLTRPMATVRLLRYPAADGADPEAPGAGAHTDYGTLTLLATDGVAGLEVRRRDGAWIDAPAVPGAFVCNIGDLLMRWTNDIYVSTPHRVRQPAAERHSIAFFLDPNPETDVAVLSTCIGEGRPARYPPILAADYLKQRLDATYDHRAAATA